MVETAPRIVTVRQGILKHNDQLAAQNRAQFSSLGLRVINLVSSPGAGKTALLVTTLRQMSLACAVAVGDLATANDADRLRATGRPAVQILTGTVCHLDAQMVQQVLPQFDLTALKVLFLENVGNLVCPSSYDLGESARVVLLSVTEGEDKPLKYPTIFNTADLVVVTKADLAEAVEFDRQLALENIDRARPGVRVLEVSSRTGQGISEWIRFVEGGL
jgi:hydrogenase nickel incorporation protein HypB